MRWELKLFLPCNKLKLQCERSTAELSIIYSPVTIATISNLRRLRLECRTDHWLVHSDHSTVHPHHTQFYCLYGSSKCVLYDQVCVSIMHTSLYIQGHVHIAYAYMVHYSTTNFKVTFFISHCKCMSIYTIYILC